MALVPYEFDAERFSRWMSYVLRHNPARYGLTPDRHGFVDFDELFRIAQRRYSGVPADQLRDLMSGGSGGRFELSGSRLRARYGHSIPVEPAGPPVEPPEWLFHGTEPERLDEILRDGLAPGGRRMVHLSDALDDALAVGRRRAEQPVVFRIAAREAHRAGVLFYHEGKVFLASAIPAAYISRASAPADAGTPPVTS